MAAGTMALEIVTPEKVAHKFTVGSVVVPTVDGYIAIWYNHAPLITAIGTGVMWYKDENGKKVPNSRFAVSSGFLEVLDNRITLFAETIEQGEEIDLERALAAKKRAEERLKLRSRDIDTDRAQFALAKAIARIRAVGKE